MIVEIHSNDGVFKYEGINQLEKTYKMENGKPVYYIYLYTKFSLNTSWKSSDIRHIIINNLEDAEF